jgi:hypothetical protein
MLRSLASGLIGAAALTAVHESARQALPHAPRMDVIGSRALAKPIRRAGGTPPRGRRMYAAAITGDVVSNALYYSMVGLGEPRHAVRRGLLLGLAAGAGAVLLPPVMGLGRQPGQRTPLTQLLTIAWYTLGGVVAGATFSASSDR